MLEIEQEGGLQAGDVQVTEHLGEVRLVEGYGYFCVHDHAIVYDEIGDERANMQTVIMNGKLPLGVTTKPLLCEFNDQRTLVELLIEPGPKREEDLVGRTDNFLGQFVEIHLRNFDHRLHGIHGVIPKQTCC